MVALVFIAVGMGGIKANIGPFGAQQLEDRGFDAVAVQSYWNWSVVHVLFCAGVCQAFHLQQDLWSSPTTSKPIHTFHELTFIPN